MALPLPKLTFVLGGARSGKSHFAEQLITAQPAPWHYLATAHAFDPEMQVRIADHQKRRGKGWVTTEVDLSLPSTLNGMDNGHPILIDCLTLWLTNVMMAGDLAGEDPTDAAIDRLMDALTAHPGPLVVVSTEVGLGIVPDNALARTFRDHAGRMHQHVAALADRVVLVVAGLPLEVK